MLGTYDEDKAGVASAQPLTGVPNIDIAPFLAGSPEGRTKVWDNRSFRSLLVTNFVVILPISISERQHAASGNAEPASIGATASSSQVAELADDLAVFQGETQHVLMVIVTLFAVTAVLALIYNVVQLLR